jgi:hypothetical protein
MNVVEMTVHHDRENVRFLLLSGNQVECSIKDITLLKEMSQRITLLVKIEKKQLRLVFDTTALPKGFMDLELIYAIAHQDVQRLE